MIWRPEADKSISYQQLFVLGAVLRSSVVPERTIAVPADIEHQTPLSAALIISSVLSYVGPWWVFYDSEVPAKLPGAYTDDAETEVWVRRKLEAGVREFMSTSIDECAARDGDMYLATTAALLESGSFQSAMDYIGLPYPPVDNEPSVVVSGEGDGIDETGIDGAAMSDSDSEWASLLRDRELLWRSDVLLRKKLLMQEGVHPETIQIMLAVEMGNGRASIALPAPHADLGLHNMRPASYDSPETFARSLLLRGVKLAEAIGRFEGWLPRSVTFQTPLISSLIISIVISFVGAFRVFGSAQHRDVLPEDERIGRLQGLFYIASEEHFSFLRYRDGPWSEDTLSAPRLPYPCRYTDEEVERCLLECREFTSAMEYMGFLFPPRPHANSADAEEDGHEPRFGGWIRPEVTEEAGFFDTRRRNLITVQGPVEAISAPPVMMVCFQCKAPGDRRMRGGDGEPFRVVGHCELCGDLRRDEVVWLYDTTSIIVGQPHGPYPLLVEVPQTLVWILLGCRANLYMNGHREEQERICMRQSRREVRITAIVRKHGPPLATHLEYVGPRLNLVL